MLLFSSTAYGEGSEDWIAVSLGYDYRTSTSIIDSDGGKLPPGDGAYPISSHRTVLGVDYRLSDTLEFDLSLPLLGIQYKGGTAGARAPHGRFDDGDLHFTATDLRLGTHYSPHKPGTLAWSYNLAASLPVQEYETTGFASAGRGLKQVHLGITAFAYLGEWIPNLSGSAGYELSLAESYDQATGLDQFEQTYGEATISLHYSLGSRFSLFASGLIHNSYDGVDFADLQSPEAFDAATFMSLTDSHDAVLNEDYLLGGPGVGYAINDALHVSASAAFFLGGRNSQNANKFSLGLRYALRKKKAKRDSDD